MTCNIFKPKKTNSRNIILCNNLSLNYLSLDAEVWGRNVSTVGSTQDCSPLLTSWVALLPFFQTGDPLIPLGGLALNELLGWDGGGVEMLSGTL